MQWLIDLIIEAIGIPPVFIDRGDPAAPDFPLAWHTTDFNWHDQDLSGIVPSNASAVLLSSWLNTANVGARLEYRKKGNVNTENIGAWFTQVANVYYVAQCIVPIGPSGILEYRVTNVVWAVLDVTIHGWWL